MRPKPAPETPAATATLCGELERLGLEHADAAALADRLVRLPRELREREARALLEGVALGQRVARQPARSPELLRMLEDLASEVQKLDEGLRVITAFLARLREQTALEQARTLH